MKHSELSIRQSLAKMYLTVFIYKIAYIIKLIWRWSSGERSVLSKEVWGWHDCSPKYTNFSTSFRKQTVLHFWLLYPLSVSHCPLPCAIKSISWLLYKYCGRKGEGQQELAGLPSALLMNTHSGTFSITLCCRMPLLLHRASLVAVLSEWSFLFISFTWLRQNYNLGFVSAFIGFHNQQGVLHSNCSYYLYNYVILTTRVALCELKML